MAILKQKELFRLITENEGKPASERKSIRQLILAAGYSQEEADNPNKILETKSWNELVDELLPEGKLLDKLHKNAMSHFGHVSNQAIDIALKVKGKYAAQKIELSTPEDEMTDEELEARAQELKAQIEKRKNPKQT